MKRLLRLLTAAGIFQALLITLSAIYWLVQPADTNAAWPLQALWDGFLKSPAVSEAPPPQSASAVDHPPLGAAAMLETSVAATLAHLPPDAFHLPLSATVPPLSNEVSLSPTTALTFMVDITPSPSSSVSATLTSTSSVTPTQYPSATATLFPTWTRTAVLSPTSSPTPKPTSTPTRTETVPPTATPDGLRTNTQAATSTPTSSFTVPPPSATPTTGGPVPTPTVDLTGCSYNSDSSVENQVLAMLNQEREAAGLPPLSMQSQLRSAAREHSADMACNNFVSHTGSNGTTSYDRITSYGYYPIWWGENIYKGWQTTPEQVVDWWMNSEPHRNNILSSYYVHIGIGFVQVGDYAAYTLNFGRR